MLGERRGPTDPEKRRLSVIPPESPARRTRPAWSQSELTRLKEQLWAQGLAPHTSTLYMRTLARADRWCAEQGWALDDVPGGVLREYAETIPRSYSSRRLLRSALRHYWSINARAEVPLWAVRVPRRPRMVCRALEEPKAAALEVTARGRDDRKGLAVLLGLYLGLRRFEIAGLRWEQFDAEGWMTLVGKGDISARLPVHPVLTAELRRLKSNEGVPWIFPNRYRSGPAHPANIWNWVHEVAKEAGVGEVTPHQLRHTCLTRANDATGDLRSVQEFARHSRPETTAGYTRVSDEQLLMVMNSLSYGPVVHEPPPAVTPLVPYEAVIAALEGPGTVRAWVELASTVDGRAGWTFEVGDGICLWRLDGSDLWAVANAVRPTPAPFELWSSDDGDVATWWAFGTPGELVAAAELSPNGELPQRPSGRVGPWIEEQWLTGQRVVTALTT